MFLTCLMVGVAGMAALTWEILWQIQASLAVGVSAKGTAITLAATMGGMSIGAWLAGKILARRNANPLYAYGVLELTIGLSGLWMLPGFAIVSMLDGAIYARSPALAPFLHFAGIVLLLGPPTLAMGATVPVFGLIARRLAIPLSRLYALNTAGAAIGVLLMSFVVIPNLGITLATRCAVVCNFSACLLSLCLSRLTGGQAEQNIAQPHTTTPTCVTTAAIPVGLIVWMTGFVTFVLEVAWFRSLRAAFQSTTDSFAIILAAVLIPLACAARLVPAIRASRITLGHTLAIAGVAILLATPLIERFDLLLSVVHDYWTTMVVWLVASLLTMGLPVLFLGFALPWLLDDQQTPGRWGRLYAWNTLGAIVGSLLAAWVLLPCIGFARTAWLAGALVVLLALRTTRGLARIATTLAGTAALLIAVTTESGLGRDRIQGEKNRASYRLLEQAEAPDSTISVIAYTNEYRALVIDGFQASSEMRTSHYMPWMGRLPMLLHPAPHDALVICFGTGQTANGVRREGPERLDVVELSPDVIRMADLFQSNEGVLQDPRVRTIVMDGRAWLRRTDRRYDVVTLEPMPPHFAGVNALYSREFYQLMAQRLNPGAIVAQWVPYHILPPEYAIHIAATFRDVFPDAIMWIDPIGKTGILLGRHGGGDRPLGAVWPGLARQAEGRDLSPDTIEAAVRLDVPGLARYTAPGLLVSDDNQRLAFGDVRRQQMDFGANVLDANLNLVEHIAAGGDFTR
ncbi:MAG: fused MFS/spermidine synthase [Verrucomicrobia bacterium]|nr:fused MFS/spermidine synthase [Verrucomicrobiota bacterium]